MGLLLLAALFLALLTAMSALAPAKLRIKTTSNYSPFKYVDNVGGIVDQTKMAALGKNLRAPVDGERI